MDNFGETAMRELVRSLTRPPFAVLACVIISLVAHAADDTALTKDQIKQFLQTAEVIRSKVSDKGVTHPLRLTLSNGTIAHDASFQPIYERKPKMTLASGKVEFNFVDSYRYNIAAYSTGRHLRSTVTPTAKQKDQLRGMGCVRGSGITLDSRLRSCQSCGYKAARLWQIR